MRRRLLLAIFTFGCGASASPATTPTVVTVPAAAPVAAATASAAPSSSALARQLDQLDTALAGAMNSRPAQSGDVPTGRLDGAASGGNAGLSGGSVIQPGAAGGGTSTIGDGGKVKGPIGKAAIGSAQVKGTIANAPAVIAGMAAGFRRCFNRGLMEDPSMKGSVTITAAIGPKGEVLSASPSGGNGLSASVMACVSARVSSAQFAPPDGGSATVSIPITFSADAP